MKAYTELALQFIDGEWRDGKSSSEVESSNPYTQESYAKFQAASLEDLDEAYEAAEKHQADWQ